MGSGGAAAERRGAQALTVRLTLAACVAACAGASSLLAQTPECPAPAPVGAESLLATGRFWHARRAAPALPRVPRPVPLSLGLLHARIHAGLRQWDSVDAVLRRVRGADSVPDVLLLRATAAARLGRPGEAERGFRRLSESPHAPEAARHVALVQRAMALEAIGRLDSAAVAWRRAAQALPEIADWLAIHRAEIERDTTLAFASVAGARTPGSRQRSEVFVAQRRVRAGNLAGAFEVFQRLNRPLDVARVEWAMGRRRTARARADSIVLQTPSRPEALLAANFLEEHHDSLTVRELTGIARTYRALGDRVGAERRYRLALRRADSSVALRVELATLLGERREENAAHRLLDSAEARARRRNARGLVALARVTVLAAARKWDQADSVLSRAVRALAGDTNVAKGVLVLAEHDRAFIRTAAELQRYRLLMYRFPDAPAANVARFRLALNAYAQGSVDSAAAGLAAALSRDTAGLLGTAPRFWDARLRWERGDSSGLGALRRIVEREPLTYYGVRARGFAGDSLDFVPDSVLPPPRPGSFPPARARERIRLLARLGFEGEARAEALGWASDSTASVRVLVAAGEAAGAAGFAREAIRLGEAALLRAGLTIGVARGVFPFPYRGVIEAEAAEHCLDPLLVAAIVRQETRFTPTAVSRAGARGISQVMPPTGREVAQRLAIRPWNPDLLFQPDFNLHIGNRFLVDRFHVDSFPVYAAIAAYNAGAQRVDRWRRWPEFPDADLFVERVAIPETRNYVRIVYASYLWYRRTYGAPAEAPSSLSPQGP